LHPGIKQPVIFFTFKGFPAVYEKLIIKATSPLRIELFVQEHNLSLPEERSFKKTLDNTSLLANKAYYRCLTSKNAVIKY